MEYDSTDYLHLFTEETEFSLVYNKKKLSGQLYFYVNRI